MICLDTNIAIRVIDARYPVVRARFERMLSSGAVVAIPAPVAFELWFGVSKSARRDANAIALNAFLASGVLFWPFDSGDAKEAGDIRAALYRAGTPIGPYDLLIAAQARRRGATLATGNQREFSRISGLQIEDWSQSL